MDIGIIIQGKPRDEWHQYTQDLDPDLRTHIIKDLFESKGQNGDEVLIARIFDWRGTLYSIYTLWVENPIVGTDNRNSFLALSIICKGVYIKLVSEVYEKLESVFKNKILGGYIDYNTNSNARYRDDIRENYTLFEELTRITKDLFSSEHLYGEFKQHPNQVRDSVCCYSILDCDSKAFLNDLLKFERIIVSEKKYPDKNSKIESGDKDLKQCQERLKEACDDANSYKRQSEQLRHSLDEAKDSTSKSEENSKSLKKKVDELRAEYDKYKGECEILNRKIKDAVTTLGAVISSLHKGSGNNNNSSNQEGANNNSGNIATGGREQPDIKKKSGLNDYLTGIVAIVAVILLLIVLWQCNVIGYCKQ